MNEIGWSGAFAVVGCAICFAAMAIAYLYFDSKDGGE